MGIGILLVNLTAHLQLLAKCDIENKSKDRGSRVNCCIDLFVMKLELEGRTIITLTFREDWKSSTYNENGRRHEGVENRRCWQMQRMDTGRDGEGRGWVYTTLLSVNKHRDASPAEQLAHGILTTQLYEEGSYQHPYWTNSKMMLMSFGFGEQQSLCFWLRDES